MRNLKKCLLFSLALMVVLSSDAAAKAVAGGEGGIDNGEVVPLMHCSITVIEPGKACVHRDCQAECRKQHGMGYCTAMGCSCAVCPATPPPSQQGN